MRNVAEDGFTLIESLVAALLLIIGIGAAITVFVSSGHAGATSERHQSGVALAQAEIEAIKAMDYDQIGLTDLNYPTPGEQLPNPAERASAGHYTPAGAGTHPRLHTERMVVADAERSFNLAPYSTAELDTRSGLETAHVYRFVTWRDEECPLLRFSDLDLQLLELGGIVTALLSELELSLGGSGLIATAQSSRGELLNLGPVSGVVSNRANDLLALIEQLLQPAYDLADQVVAPALDQLVVSLSSLSGLDLTLDLCDIDLSSLQRLQTVESALESLEAPLANLTGAEIGRAAEALDEATTAAEQAAAHQQYCKPRPLNLNCLLSGLWGTLVSTLNGLVGGVSDLLAGGGGSEPGLTEQIELAPTAFGAALDGATEGTITDLAQLPDFVDATLAGLSADGTDENTKRVVVAVVLQNGGPAGPRQPIWLSTVITDPWAGLVQE